MSEMVGQDPTIDVVELCAILQCLGFTVKSLDASDANLSQEGGTRTVVVNCQASGLHVVLESANVPCSCPATEQQNSGFWQVSGVTGGKQHQKESGSAILRSLPKYYRERLSKDLREMVATISRLDADQPRINKSASMVELASKSASLVELNREGNKSASMVELSTPEKRQMLLKVETPSRYRSLDALTSAKEEGETSRTLQKQYTAPGGEDVIRKETAPRLNRRQSTYTVCSTPGSVRRRNKTSSPIQAPQNNLLDSLMEAEKVAENLRNKLANVIKEFMEEGKNDSSMSSMLDVSKISVLKGSETSKAQFASSPNLSGVGIIREDFPKSRLKRFESASTSNLSTKPLSEKDGKSKLRRISPNMFKLKREPSKTDKIADGKSKLQSLFRPRIVTPVRVPKPTSEASPNLSSASKKKFSHVKSTIPRPAPKKE